MREKLLCTTRRSFFSGDHGGKAEKDRLLAG